MPDFKITSRVTTTSNGIYVSKVAEGRVVKHIEHSANELVVVFRDGSMLTINGCESVEHYPDLVVHFEEAARA